MFIVRDLFISVVLAMLVIILLYQPVKVEGTSMMPSLGDEERIFVNKFVYRFGIQDIHRGDMVVFWFPADTTKSYIKRVIGLPGDVIEIRDGGVWINDQPLEEQYVPDDFRSRDTMEPRIVPEDSYYVLGDHRNSSNDSRAWGPVHRRYVYGKAVFVYWPIERIGPLD